jgi:hypothetical protein
MLYRIIVSAFLLLPGVSLAGASNATLECNPKSAQSSTTLTGSIPGDFAEFSLQLKNKNGVVNMSENNETINVIADFKKGVFTVAVTLKDTRNLLLYAIPNTVKTQSGGANRQIRARFDAILLEAPKPGYNGEVTYDSLIRKVPLACTYEYEI